jgi:hypothetical protein
LKQYHLFNDSGFLAAPVTHLNWQKVLAQLDPMDAHTWSTNARSEKNALDRYFGQFAEKGDSLTLDDMGMPKRCFKCGLHMGLIFSIFDPDNITRLEFTDGKPGEAHCRSCGWPYRCIHQGIGLHYPLRYALPYHPDLVRR